MPSTRRPKALPRPTVARVQGCLRRWKTLEKYTAQESSLNRLFQKLCPTNRKLSDVLLKVSALNDFYSTNIYATHAVAKHILSVRIGARLAHGDKALVNDVASIRIRGRSIRFYSFATKYCNHHHPEAFPIYDSYVDKMLMQCQRQFKFAAFRKRDLKDYPAFVSAIQAFRSHFGLQRFTLRQIDIYLWLEGKRTYARYQRPA